MVRDVFRLTRENAPAVIFIDEVDAIATKRFDAQTGADREVQRILLELLNQMDGFDQSTNVKVIMATNRQDTLDPALLRPGRIDRCVYVAPPAAESRAEILRIALRKVPTDVDAAGIDALVEKTAGFSGAEVVALCREAALGALDTVVREAGGDAAYDDEAAARDVVVRLGDLVRAAEATTPQITEEVLAFYTGWKRTGAGAV